MNKVLWTLCFVWLGIQQGVATTYTMQNDGNFLDSSNWDVFPDFQNLNTDDIIVINTAHAFSIDFSDISGGIQQFTIGPSCKLLSFDDFFLFTTELTVEGNGSLDIDFLNFDVVFFSSDEFTIVNFNTYSYDSFLNYGTDGSLYTTLTIHDQTSLLMSLIAIDEIHNYGLLEIIDNELFVDGPLINCSEIRNINNLNTSLEIHCTLFQQEPNLCDGATITGFQNVIIDCPDFRVKDLTVDP